jgi:hypothetical protein
MVKKKPRFTSGLNRVKSVAAIPEPVRMIADRFYLCFAPSRVKISLAGFVEQTVDS